MAKDSHVNLPRFHLSQGRPVHGGGGGDDDDDESGGGGKEAPSGSELER